MRVLRLLPFLVFTACFGTSLGDPCEQYCDYVCTCHEGEAEFDCDQCRTEYASADSELQDECETSLTDLQREDESNGTGCDASSDDTGV